MTHEHPVGIGGMHHSDLQARRPMNWDRPDCDLLAFYGRLIRERKDGGRFPDRPLSPPRTRTGGIGLPLSACFSRIVPAP